MEFRDLQWKYINEGNVHIVLQILNTSHVLRLVKEDDKPINLESIKEATEFVNLVTAPLICDCSQYREELVHVSTESLYLLNEELHKIRPQHRQIKSVLSTYAIKAPNLTIVSENGVNYCLEIKPKEGFKSGSLEKLPKCYYCLKQFLKLKEKQIDSISSYCPLDLFSGDFKIMKRALLSLFHNPQNNIKIFKDGEIIYSEKSVFVDFEVILKNMNIFSSTNLFLDFIIHILLSNGMSDSVTSESEEVLLESKSKECIENSNLKSDSFLYKLLNMQKLSEKLPVHAQETVSGYHYVQEVLKELKTHNFNLNIEEDRYKFLSTTDPIHLHLISAVAKDCSIMISFSSDIVNGLPKIQVDNKKISYRISVTDLEPKSANTLVKRKRTEDKLIEVYQRHLESPESLQCKYFRIQPHQETRTKQLEAWQQLIAEYMKATKQSTIDIRESQNSPLFNNASINRKLSQEAILTVLEDMARTGRAAPVDKSKNVWEIYWHSLDEWGNMVYGWACSNGLNNTVCTLFELVEGENTVGEEFHGLDMNVLIKALKSLEVRGKCELMQFDDSQGVKFF